MICEHLLLINFWETRKFFASREIQFMIEKCLHLLKNMALFLYYHHFCNLLDVEPQQCCLSIPMGGVWSRRQQLLRSWRETWRCLHIRLLLCASSWWSQATCGLHSQWRWRIRRHCHLWLIETAKHLLQQHLICYMNTTAHRKYNC